MEKDLLKGAVDKEVNHSNVNSWFPPLCVYCSVVLLLCGLCGGLRLTSWLSLFKWEKFPWRVHIVPSAPSRIPMWDPELWIIDSVKAALIVSLSFCFAACLKLLLFVFRASKVAWSLALLKKNNNPVAFWQTLNLQEWRNEVIKRSWTWRMESFLCSVLTPVSCDETFNEALNVWKRPKFWIDTQECFAALSVMNTWR